MDYHERKQHRHRTKANKRQTNYRQRQKAKGLFFLQLRISRMVHARAIAICEANGINLTKLYHLAIDNTAIENPPAKPFEPVSGDLVGTQQITPWMEQETVDRFELIATNYKTRCDAITAIVHAYCENVEACNLGD